MVLRLFCKNIKLEILGKDPSSVLESYTEALIFSGAIVFLYFYFLLALNINQKNTFNRYNKIHFVPQDYALEFKNVSSELSEEQAVIGVKV